jgi:hypothetical protein
MPVSFRDCLLAGATADRLRRVAVLEPAWSVSRGLQTEGDDFSYKVNVLARSIPHMGGAALP